MDNQQVSVQINIGELIQAVDNLRLPGDLFKLPVWRRTLLDTRLADLKAKHAATASSEGGTLGSSTEARAALDNLLMYWRDGYNIIRGIPSYQITDAQRLSVLTSYGWEGGLIGDFTDSRVEYLANQAMFVTPQIATVAHRYPVQLIGLIEDQLLILNANQPIATGGLSQMATAARVEALTLMEAVTSRVRFYYCCASDERESTPELARIGFQPKRGPGEAETQLLPDAPGPVTYDAIARTLLVNALIAHATFYRAFRQPAGGQPELAGESDTTTVSVVQFSPLTPGVTYEFWLVGVNSRGEGPESNHITHVAT